MLRESEKSLSIQYFSREFPAGLEVEWKTGLASCDPAGFIFKLDDCLLCGELFPFFKARTMGNQPIGISYLNIWCHYYGHLKQGKWVEDLVLVQPPATPIFIPRVKVDRAGDYNNLPENVLVREETKGTKFEILFSLALPHPKKSFLYFMTKNPFFPVFIFNSCPFIHSYICLSSNSNIFFVICSLSN